MSRVAVKDLTREFLAVASTEIEKAVAQSGAHVQKNIVHLLQRHSSLPPSPPSPPGRPPGVMTGELMGSIAHEEFRKGRVFVSRIGSNLPYAKKQEIGGTVTSGGKMLTVPLTPEARRIRMQHLSLRSANLAFIKRPGRAPLLVRRHAKMSKPLFVLVRSVRLPPRPYLRPGLARSRKGIMAIIRKAGGRIERRGPK